MQKTVIFALCLIAITTCDAFLGLRRPMILPGMGRRRLGMVRHRGVHRGGYGFDDNGFDGGYDGYDNGYGRMRGGRVYGDHGYDGYGDYSRDTPDFLDYGRMGRGGYY